MQEGAHVEKMLGKQLGCDMKHQHPFSGLITLFWWGKSLGVSGTGSPHCLGKCSLPLLWSLGSHTLQPGPRVPETLTPPNLIHKPSLLSQTGCPLGDFWGCYGSKIDNSHLKRQFSVAQEDQQHPSCLYPTGAGIYDHRIYFSCIFQKSL